MKILIILIFILNPLLVLAAKKDSNIKAINSPRAAFRSLVELSKANNTTESIKYFDFRHISNTKRQKDIASKMNKILNRKFNYGYETISPLPLGSQKDGLPFYREKIITLNSKSESFAIYFDRLKGKGGSRWLVSPVTISNVDNFHSDISNKVLGSISLPAFFFKSLFGMPLYYYLLILFYGFISFVAVYLINPLKPIFKILFAGGKRTLKSKISQFNFFILSPIKLFSFTACWFIAANSLPIPVNVFNKIQVVFVSIVLFSIAWLLSKLVDFIALMLEQNNIGSKKIKHSSTFFSGKLGAKVLLYLIFLLILLQNWGIDVTAIFASLGVGGIAIALAGQKTIENLFGGIMLATDRPVAIGDYCKFGDKSGVVEEIGPRSTKIRTLDRTLVVIPNGDFSQMQLENYRKRDKIRLKSVIGLTYSTTPTELRHVLKQVREMLILHEKIETEGLRVRFINLGAYSLDIEIFCLAKTAEWSDFLEIKEDILLKLMDIVVEAGCSFAFPTQTVELSKD